MPDQDAMTIGFLAACFVWTVWWNLDWRRYLKFYRIKGPGYPMSVQLPFRVFFALCSVGAAVELGRRLLPLSRTTQLYRQCFLVGLGWLGAIVLIVVVVELASGTD